MTCKSHLFIHESYLQFTRLHQDSYIKWDFLFKIDRLLITYYQISDLSSRFSNGGCFRWIFRIVWANRWITHLLTFQCRHRAFLFRSTFQTADFTLVWAANEVHNHLEWPYAHRIYQLWFLWFTCLVLQRIRPKYLQKLQCRCIFRPFSFWFLILVPSVCTCIVQRILIQVPCIIHTICYLTNQYSRIAVNYQECMMFYFGILMRTTYPICFGQVHYCRSDCLSACIDSVFHFRSGSPTKLVLEFCQICIRDFRTSYSLVLSNHKQSMRIPCCRDFS